MSEYKPVPVHVASQIASHFDKSIVVVVCYDREHGLTHVTTYGKSAEDKALAAGVGDAMIPLLNMDGERKQSFEDFRTIDLAAAKLRIDQLQSGYGFTADGVCLFDCEKLYCPYCKEEVRRDSCGFAALCNNCENPDDGCWPHHPPRYISEFSCLSSPTATPRPEVQQ